MFSQRQFLSVTVVLFASAVALRAAAQTPSTQPAPHTTPDASERIDSALLDRLAHSVVDSEYERVDFSRVIDDLRKRFNLNIHVSWTVLEAAGIRRDTRIELRLQRVTLSTLINYVLDEASPETELAYHVSGGVLVISTAEALAKQTVRRSYEVTDLLTSKYAARRFANTPILRLRRAGGESAGGTPVATGRGGGLYGGGGSSSAPAEAAEDEAPAFAVEFIDIQTLIDLITQTVAPESWRTAGGNVGAISVLGARLMVTQTIVAHQEIESLLADLRRSAPPPLNGDVLIVRMPTSRAQSWRESSGNRFPRLSDAAVQSLVTDAAVQTILRGSTSGRSGERMWFSALREQALLSRVVPIVGDGVWAVEPAIDHVCDGLELLLLPMLTPDGRSLMLDVQMALAPEPRVQSRVMPLGPAADGTVPDAGSGRPVAPDSQEPRERSVGGAVSTTVDLPVRHMRTVSALVHTQAGEWTAFSITDLPNSERVADPPQDWLLVTVRRSAP